MLCDFAADDKVGLFVGCNTLPPHPGGPPVDDVLFAAAAGVNVGAAIIVGAGSMAGGAPNIDELAVTGVGVLQFEPVAGASVML